MYWHVLYTKPKNEKKVAQRLNKMGVEVFCPVIIERRQWSDRIKKIETPLFKSMVFVKINHKNRNRVFDVPGVVRFMYWLGKLAEVKNEEINIIKEWLNGEFSNRVKLENLTPGDKVSIASGKLKNKQAVIKEIGKKSMRLILPKLGFTVVVNNHEVIDN